MNVHIPIKEAEAIRDRQWWTAECMRQGTNWRGLALALLQTTNSIAPCDVCGCEPCAVPTFCQLCREADAKASRRREGNRPRPTPTATIEAVKQAVRDGGLPALKEPNTRERLSRCDDAARAEIDRWLQARKRAAA
jgi:hypothetical protein